MNVRPAQPGDLLSLLRLIDRAPELEAHELTDLQRAMWARVMGTDDLKVYLAEDADGDILGTTSMLVMPHITYDCRPTAFIEAMVVAESHRRHGIGRTLVERALADASAQGCHKVQLLTHKRHAEDGAHAFYRSLGFTPEAEGFRLFLDDRDRSEFVT